MVVGRLGIVPKNLEKKQEEMEIEELSRLFNHNIHLNTYKNPRNQRRFAVTYTPIKRSPGNLGVKTSLGVK